MKQWFPLLILFMLLTFCSFLMASALLQAAEGSIGKVIGLAGDAVIEREGREFPVDVGIEIRISDSVRTGPEGRVRILFNDDSMAAVGPGAFFRMDEYQDTGSDQSFKAHVAEGLARFVTGKIVEANPKGFQVTAPEAVVGIRGTIISVRAESERTIVYVENTTRNVYANNVDVPSGNKISFPGGTDLPEPITPEDRREISKDLAFLGGDGSAAAPPAPASEETRNADASASESEEGSSDSGSAATGSGGGSTGSGGGSTESGTGSSGTGVGASGSGSGSTESGTFAGTEAVLSGGSFGEFSLASSPLASQSLGDSIQPGAVYASYSYSGLVASYIDMNLGFDINLQNGDIRNAFITADFTYSYYEDFSITGGTGGFRSDGGWLGYYASGFTGHFLATNAFIYVDAPPYSLGDSTMSLTTHFEIWNTSSLTSSPATYAVVADKE
jgi:hypothetical protein